MEGASRRRLGGSPLLTGSRRGPGGPGGVPGSPNASLRGAAPSPPLPSCLLPGAQRRGAGEGSEQGRGGGGKRRRETEKKKKIRNPTPDHRCRSGAGQGSAQLPLEAPSPAGAWERGCGSAGSSAVHPGNAPRGPGGDLGEPPRLAAPSGCGTPGEVLWVLSPAVQGWCDAPQHRLL